MRVHSDILTENDVLTAALQVGVIVHGLRTHGSRSRDHAINFYLEGNGVYGGQWGTMSEKSATWDEWGGVIGLLFTRDPLAHYGKHSYQSADHFNWLTGNRFVKGMPADHHYRHTWDYANREQNVTGRYWVTPCKKCTAIIRYLPNMTWEQFQAVSA